MADDRLLLEEHVTAPLGADDIATIMKNLHANVQELRSENDTLKAKLSTVKSNAIVVPPRTITSVAIRLYHDDDDQRDASDVQVFETGKNEKKALEITINTETQRKNA